MPRLSDIDSWIVFYAYRRNFRLPWYLRLLDVNIVLSEIIIIAESCKIIENPPASNTFKCLCMVGYRGRPDKLKPTLDSAERNKIFLLSYQPWWLTI